jgi:RNA polymerase sigma-70 factor (ECF subfamily)
MSWKTGNHRGGPTESPGSGRPEDEEILAAVRALQAGAGSNAFEPVYNRFYRPLRNFFSKRVRREEAEDLAQITLTRAWQNWGEYRSEGRLSAWILKIGKNVWLNTARDDGAAKRGSGLVSLASEVAEEEASPLDVAAEGLTPEEALLAEERTRVLYDAIEALPPGMRKLTELRLHGDLSYQEISDATGTGLNTVRSQLFEARQRLKPVLEKYFQGAGLDKF